MGVPANSRISGREFQRPFKLLGPVPNRTWEMAETAVSEAWWEVSTGKVAIRRLSLITKKQPRRPGRQVLAAPIVPLDISSLAGSLDVLWPST